MRYSNLFVLLSPRNMTVSSERMDNPAGTLAIDGEGGDGPKIDKPVVGLIPDSQQRGLLHETQSSGSGESGRLPTHQGSSGRDRNPREF